MESFHIWNEYLLNLVEGSTEKIELKDKYFSIS